jgi:hypothetical protein
MLTTRNRIPASLLSEEALIDEFKAVAAEFDESREGDGHGGSPGEWAYERCGECEHEMKKRGIMIPS